MYLSSNRWQKPLFLFLIVSIALSACAPLEKLGLIPQRPNIIFILTDDMDNYLLPYMPRTNELIGEQGAVFTNYFVTTPLCCPSRTTTISGQYAHNTNIMENAPGFRNFFSNNREEETIAVWLNDGGYRTSLIGKYLNGYPVAAWRKYIPPGWTDWHVFFHHEVTDDDGGYYYHYAMSQNGVINNYEYAPEDYSTDVLTTLSLAFLETALSNNNTPFFLFISPTTPHGPSLPAPRHEGVLEGVQYPRVPSFLTEDITPKPETVIEYATTQGEEFQYFDADHFFQLRAESLLSVDEMVEKIVRRLEEAGQLDNTYIIFTSDNGFHMGEHNFSGGKGLPYTEDIKVPFLIRGPGITPGTTVTQLTANIDLASTFADIANVNTADFVDGRSFLPLAQIDGPAAEWRNALLVESGYTNRQTRVVVFRGIRTANYLYVEYPDGTLEYYDLINDPYERHNIIEDLDDATRVELHDWLEKLKTCEAETCREIENSLPASFHP